jgi:serine/threonine-protein kinase
MIGEAVGHYRIVEKIGEGGMGVVYRALDTRLRRTVAIKVLRPEIATNPARVARFEREARLLAALSHPNIGAIHGLEEHNGQFWLVLEFVEGDTLAAIIGHGPVPVRRVVDIAGQVARAIESAHEKGIVHRDLKPANVKVRPDGTVKVLDFGLAKALADDFGSEDSTTTDSATREGTILGTPAYMSPEQACGAPVGSPTDIWAFGCTLFELLSGQKPFKGSTSAEVRAAVVRGEPAWGSLLPDTPAPLRMLVRSCLEIEPNNRLHHMGDARLFLDSALTDATSSSQDLVHPIRKRQLTRGLVLAAAFTVAGGFVGVAVSHFFVRSEPASPIHLPLAPPFEHEPRFGFGPSVAISPDGRSMVYALESGTTTLLYLKRLDELDARPIAGTQGARNPFFSPGGEWVGFYDDDDRKLKRVSIRGGEPVAILSTDFQGGADWGPDDTIVFASNAGLMRVPAGGGAIDQVTAGEDGKMWPTLLPGGKVVIFSRLSARGTFDDAEIVAVRLPRGEPQVVLKSAYYPHYAPTGHLIFVQGDSVLAAPFNVDALEVTGPAVTILRDLWISSWTGYADFGFSHTGTLAYVSGGRQPTQATLVTVERSGREHPFVDDRRAYRVPRVSPDGRQVAMTLVDQQVDVWISDLDRKSLHRLTDSPSWDAYPLWQPGVRWMAFASMRDGVASIYRQELNTGAIEKLVATDRPVYPNSWSSDGKLLAYHEENPQTGTDIWIYSTDTRTAKEFLRTPFNERHAEFSPDGRFIAYESGEGGEQLEVYVRPYPQINPRTKISTNGGTSPRWGPSGRELFYRIGGKLMAVSLTSTPELGAGPPRELFEGPYGSYDVLPNGQSFIMVKERSAGDTPTRINLVLNWFEEVKRLAGSAAPSGRTR